MVTLYELEKTRNRYYSLKDELDYLLNYLNSSIDSLSVASDTLSQACNVDNNSSLGDSVAEERNNLIYRRDFIKETIIPNINLEINRLKKLIEEEQMKLT